MSEINGPSARVDAGAASAAKAASALRSCSPSPRGRDPLFDAAERAALALAEAATGWPTGSARSPTKSGPRRASRTTSGSSGPWC